ncbi:hypothetical protein LshimejAT787_1602300 [Lyophyllum shimeji]|uniref:Uncharacterized protein n=1 Tax=Lyophyllum shimeji TaxID=47721 RepID=A0A9P3PYF0_LYOSH|nr:hypothetical protein LshimejAT787_1602300 [Lyophyllum shimeji]
MSRSNETCSHCANSDMHATLYQQTLTCGPWHTLIRKAFRAHEDLHVIVHSGRQSHIGAQTPEEKILGS